MTWRIFLLVVMVLFALRAVSRFMNGLSQGARAGSPRARASDPPVKMMKDPVCGTFVVPGKALSAVSDGATVWFCSEHCRDTFTHRA